MVGPPCTLPAEGDAWKGRPYCLRQGLIRTLLTKYVVGLVSVWSSVVRHEREAEIWVGEEPVWSGHNNALLSNFNLLSATQDGATPLHAVSVSGCVLVLAILLQAGADVHATSKVG